MTFQVKSKKTGQTATVYYVDNENRMFLIYNKGVKKWQKIDMNKFEAVDTDNYGEEYIT